jgi:hypothetical protein
MCKDIDFQKRANRASGKKQPGTPVGSEGSRFGGGGGGGNITKVFVMLMSRTRMG